MNKLSLPLFSFESRPFNGFDIDTNLLLMGGGARPLVALKKFIDYAGGDNANILVVTWASENPENISKELQDEFASVGAINIKISFRPNNRAHVLLQLENADGVFFSGGDQNRLMKAINKLDLMDTFHKMYKEGTMFGGTSAGSAIMAEYMMTGDYSDVGTGLGLVKNAILDQHFLLRNREERLREALNSEDVPFGIGLDEGAALFIQNNNVAELIGKEKVMIFDYSLPAKKAEFLLDHSQIH